MHELVQPESISATFVKDFVVSMVVKCILMSSCLFPICFKIGGSSRDQSMKMTSVRGYSRVA